MEFVIQVAIALLAVSLAGAQHLAMLGSVADRVLASSRPKWQRFQILLLTATVGQSLAALIFGFAFVLSMRLGLGEFQEVSQPEFLQVFTFSMVNLTTLGLGDLVPTAEMKFLAGVEAMTGFLLISCSASHVFQVMRD
ncbi:ion channel [Aurantiacibacter hainanensis]|uniref:ion channel n=1 Tax=Aurantiacibacter hainanensis TaxID=3076114 RepID=UPI0030C74EFE